MRALAILYAALVILQLAPVWFAHYLPTGDGPSHLYGAWLLRELALHRVDGVIASYYHVDWQPVPNWAADAFMATAMSILTPVAAEKLFFSLIIIVFLAGAWMFAGADDPANTVYAFLTLPLAYNQLLQAGFYNFSLGVGLYLVTVAFWWKRRDNPSWRTLIFVASLLLLCYFAHLMSAMLAIGNIGILWLCSVRGRVLHRHALHLLAILPTLALLIWFLGRQPAIRVAAWEPSQQLIAYLTRTQLLYTFDQRQIVFGRIFFVMMLSLFAITFFGESFSRVAGKWVWKLRERDAFLAVALGMIVLYFCSPAETAGGAVINERLALFVIVSPVAWLSPRMRKFVGIPLVAVFSVIAILNAGFQLRHFRQCSRATQRFLAAMSPAEPNTVVLTLLFTRYMPGAYIGFHVHAIDYVAIEKRLVDLGYYQPGTDYFPIRYNAGVRRPDILEIEGHPERVDLKEYPSADYVFTWLMPSTTPIRSQLEQQFDRVAAANGGELFRRRN